jgi:hypothetical protein
VTAIDKVISSAKKTAHLLIYICPSINIAAAGLPGNDDQAAMATLLSCISSISTLVCPSLVISQGLGLTLFVILLLYHSPQNE